MSEQAITPKHPGGRPSDYTDATVNKLVAVLQMGLSISTACDAARISRETYYKWLKDKEGFSDRMADAQNHGKLLAGNIVADVLQDSMRGKLDTKSGKPVPYKYSESTRVATARWYLEKQEREKFSSGGILGAKVETNDKGGTTATLIYATDGQFNQLFDRIGTAPGIEDLDPAELLEISEGSGQETDMAGGEDQERSSQVHSEELQDQHTADQSLSQP